jgi:glycosyltransferase involved in cell wall biosynthesis
MTNPTDELFQSLLAILPERSIAGPQVKFSIIVPVYKSGLWLRELVQRLENALLPYGKTFEIILVNDASPDTVTWETIRSLCEEHSWVKGIDMLYNCGQFRAVICGMENARGEFIITMDDDLQHPPEEVPKLIDAMLSHSEADCVFGTYETKQHSGFRRIGTLLIYSLLDRLYNKPKHLRTTSFRLLHRRLVNAIVAYRGSHPQITPIILKSTKNIINIEVKHNPRPHGESGYSTKRLIQVTLDCIINVSTIPLKLVSSFGFITAGISFFIGGIYFIRYLFGQIGVKGFTTLTLLITFFSGCILLSIGILGEYIGRIIRELTGLPRHIVKTSINID